MAATVWGIEVARLSATRNPAYGWSQHRILNVVYLWDNGYVNWLAKSCPSTVSNGVLYYRLLSTYQPLTRLKKTFSKWYQLTQSDKNMNFFEGSLLQFPFKVTFPYLSHEFFP